MKSLEQWFAEYGESHQNPTNQIIHKICVPLIFFLSRRLLTSVASATGTFAVGRTAYRCGVRVVFNLGPQGFRLDVGRVGRVLRSFWRNESRIQSTLSISIYIRFSLDRPVHWAPDRGEKALLFQRLTVSSGGTLVGHEVRF